MKIKVVKKTYKITFVPEFGKFPSSTTFGTGIPEQWGFGNMLNSRV